MAQGFAYREILGKSIHRYGFSASHRLDEAGVREAIDLGGGAEGFGNPRGVSMSVDGNIRP
jgi:hypothetical protein